MTPIRTVLDFEQSVHGAGPGVPVERPASSAVAIVLAGTYPSTERLFATALPRPLLPVAQVPVVMHVLRWLTEGAIERATICSNAGSRSIAQILGNGHGAALCVDHVEDIMPRGPAGAARDAGLRCGADTFVVVDGTVIPNLALDQLLETHQASGAAVTVVVHHTRRTSAERVATPAGIYVFNRAALETVPRVGFQDIKEHLLPLLRSRGERIAAYVSSEFCPRVLNTATYLAVNHWMIDRMAVDRTALDRWGPFAVAGGLIAHPTADVHPTATIVGPVLLGAGVAVGADALLVGPTSIGAGTVVGAGAAVCRSIVWHESRIGEGSFVDGSVVGHDVTVAAGAAVHHDVCVDQSRRRRERAYAPVPPLRPATAGAARSMVDLAIP